MNVGLVKTSLVNFPGRVAAAVFLPGCNLRCPFCHNAELASASIVTGPKSSADENAYVTLDEVYAHLEKRKNVLGGIAITGGEPLLSPALFSLIAKARSLGLEIKIDTNGIIPDRLIAILDNEDLCPDMIALDIKTSPARYTELAAEPSAGEHAGKELLRTISILSHANFARQVRVEYRTVLVPGLVGENEIRIIAGLLAPDSDWELAKFVPGSCLDSSWNDIDPYGPVELKRLVSIAETLNHGTKLR